MKNEFLHALGTDKANKNTDLSLYAKFPQPNNYVVNPVYNWQLGFIADGKYCIVRI